MRSGASSSHLATSMLSYAHFSLAPISRWLQIFEFILALRLQWHVNASAQLQRGRGPDCAAGASGQQSGCWRCTRVPTGLTGSAKDWKLSHSHLLDLCELCLPVRSLLHIFLGNVNHPALNNSQQPVHIPTTRTAIRSHGTTVRQRVGLICLNESRSFCALVSVACCALCLASLC